jgi:flagellar biogenesis protein FliO
MSGATADPFASTTAGWLTGILLPILLIALIGCIGYVFRSFSRSLAEQSRALTIISTQFVPIQRDVEKTQTDVASLKTETALLRQTIDKHEAWHARHDTGST